MSILLIISAILFSIGCAIKPIRIKGWYLGMALAPILTLLILIPIGIVDIEIIKEGILGNDQLKPWEIILIFFTVAYVSVSVDITGLFDFFAYKIIHAVNGDGKKLFFFFYIFACILTIFTSNDIVILTLTPIIFYLGKHGKLNVVPLLFAEFFGANTASMLLYIGNPTNIIVGNALGLGFFEYTKVMWFPTLVAAVGNLLLLYAFFRKKITQRFTLNKKSIFIIRNTLDASISLFLLLCMFATLLFSDYLNLEIWQITSIFAMIFILEDIFFGIFYVLKTKVLHLDLQHDKSQISRLYGIPEEPNEFFMAFKRIPWKILPFIAVFFILISGLTTYGFTQAIASMISITSQTLFSSILTNGIVGFFLANIVNNQPMTIFMSNILLLEDISTQAFTGGAYAVVIASNLGANLTIIGALAGLMWKNILETKGIKVSYGEFLKVGMIITPVIFILSLLTLYLVLR